MKAVIVSSSYSYLERVELLKSITIKKDMILQFF